MLITWKQAQTPAQRKANAKFSSLNEKKMGKPPAAVKKEQFKSPISPLWLGKLPFPGVSWKGDLGAGDEWQMGEK